MEGFGGRLFSNFENKVKVIVVFRILSQKSACSDEKLPKKGEKNVKVCLNLMNYVNSNGYRKY